MTVAELLHRMSARELAAWAVYEETNGPLGPVRDDHLAAMVAWRVVNVMRDPNGPEAKFSDILPRWERPAEEDVDGERDQEPFDPADPF